jgi:AraC-like DNA-binding protein
VRGIGFRGRDAVHLLGFFVMLILNVRVLISDRAELAALSARWYAGERTIGLWFDVPLLIYSLSYVAAALLLVRGYRRTLRQRRSDADRWSLRWLDTMAGCQIAIWSMAVLQRVADGAWFNYWLLFGMIALWVCVVGWLSLNQVGVPSESEPEDAGEVSSESHRAAASALADDSRLEAVEARLTQLMKGEGALYLEPALTIAQVSKRSGYPEYLVSVTINRRLGGTFWDYINRLRIEAVCERLKDSDDRRTVLDIAYACGFTSKSTFNTAFKRQVGVTPSTFRKQTSSAHRL